MATAEPLSKIFPEQYEVVAIFSGAELAVTPQALAEANLLFAELGWPAIPEFEIQVTGAAPSSNTLDTPNRIVWYSPDYRWHAYLGVNRAGVQYRAVGLTKTDEPLALASFCDDAAKVFGELLTHYRRIAHRLSFKNNGWVEAGMIHDFENLSARLFRHPKGTNRSICPEWMWQQVMRGKRSFGDCTEVLNEIFTLHQLEHPILRFGERSPGLRLITDINTLPTSTTSRFDGEQAREFVRSAPAWEQALRQDLGALLI